MPTAPPRHRPAKPMPRARRETPEQSRQRHAERENNWLGTAAWQKARKAFLSENPLCVACQAKGELVSSTVVDHVKPHRHEDVDLFWDQGNWQALCKRCHDRKTARGE